jgi:hypothetical protein
VNRHRPGERVLKSGIYRVSHDSHRLMHEAALRSGDIFPCCRQCRNEVRFELVRIVQGQMILPFRSGEILAACWRTLENFEYAE